MELDSEMNIEQTDGSSRSADPSDSQTQADRKNLSPPDRKRKPSFLIVGLVAITVLVGIPLADDFGASFDEPYAAALGSQTVAAYLTMTAPSEFSDNNRWYGPIYSSAREVVTEVVEAIIPRWVTYDVGHYVYFLSLPIAIASLYFIAQRWTSRIAALAATLLFATQPLIFGHAFINPKDTPFLAFFLASIALGLHMVDKMDQRGLWAGSPNNPSTWSEIGDAAKLHFADISWSKKAIFSVLLLLAILFTAELIALQQWIYPGFIQLVRSAYQGQAWAPINRLFSTIAGSGTEVSVELYVNKAGVYFESAKRALSVLSFAPALMVAAIMVVPLARFIQPKGLLRAVLASALALGLASSIRVVAPFAGLIVSAIAILKARKGSLLPLTIYWVIAVIVAYATWPYLWGAPVQRFWESFQAMSGFDQELQVLFDGTVRSSLDMPRNYVPYSLGIQLTEPVLLLAIAGLVIGVDQIVRRSEGWYEKILMGAWALIPLTAAAISPPSSYDNARQYLFILPPIFLFASLAIDALFRAVKSKTTIAVAIVIILLPGILGIVRLHPYEYVYHNSLVGGVSGAFRRYEQDYWLTSYREAIEIVNEEAPLSATVYIWGPWDLAWHLAREDLIPITDPASALDPEEVDFIIVSTRANADIPFQQGTEQVGDVTISGATLSYVLKVLK